MINWLHEYQNTIERNFHHQGTLIKLEKRLVNPDDCKLFKGELNIESINYDRIFKIFKEGLLNNNCNIGLDNNAHDTFISMRNRGGAYDAQTSSLPTPKASLNKLSSARWELIDQSNLKDNDEYFSSDDDDSNPQHSSYCPTIGIQGTRTNASSDHEHSIKTDSPLLLHPESHIRNPSSRSQANFRDDGVGVRDSTRRTNVSTLEGVFGNQLAYLNQTCPQLRHKEGILEKYLMGDFHTMLLRIAQDRRSTNTSRTYHLHLGLNSRITLLDSSLGSCTLTNLLDQLLHNPFIFAKVPPFPDQEEFRYLIAVMIRLLSIRLSGMMGIPFGTIKIPAIEGPPITGLDMFWQTPKLQPIMWQHPAIENFWDPTVSPLINADRLQSRFFHAVEQFQGRNRGGSHQKTRNLLWLALERFMEIIHVLIPNLDQAWWTEMLLRVYVGVMDKISLPMETLTVIRQQLYRIMRTTLEYHHPPTDIKTLRQLQKVDPQLILDYQGMLVASVKLQPQQVIFHPNYDALNKIAHIANQRYLRKVPELVIAADNDLIESLEKRWNERPKTPEMMVSDSSEMESSSSENPLVLRKRKRRSTLNWDEILLDVERESIDVDDLDLYLQTETALETPLYNTNIDCNNKGTQTPIDISWIPPHSPAIPGSIV